MGSRGPNGPPGGVTARRIILEAYHLGANYQLSGGPDWLDSDKFDLEANSGTVADENQLRLMLRTMLSQRFKLVLHRETREMSVYALTVSKNGPKLHELQEGEPTPSTTPQLIAVGAASPGRAEATAHMFSRGSTQFLADRLSGLPPDPPTGIDRPVLDRTGLKGVYLLYLEFNPGEDLKAVVLEEMGLKLEPRQAPVEILVIDHVEKPDEN
jgi:uncharacterized protein (TIGR03435 family)